MRLSTGAKRLKEVLSNNEPAAIATSLDCTVATVYNLVAGGHPSLRVALAAERVYSIPCHAWEDFEPKRVSK